MSQYFNRQISVPLATSRAAQGSPPPPPPKKGSANDSTASRPLTPHDQPLMLAAGITKLAHLQVALQQQHPPAFTACLQSVLTTDPHLGKLLLRQHRQLLPGSRAFQHPAASSFRTPKQASITHSTPVISCKSAMLGLPQLPALCMPFLGTLLDLGGVPHGNQLGQLLRFTHKGSCGDGWALPVCGV